MSLFAGMDWTEESHLVLITNEVGDTLDAFSIENSLVGIDTLINRISSFEEKPSDIHIVSFTM